MMKKEEARRLAKKIRKNTSYSINELNNKIKPYLNNVETVGIYYPLNGEIDLLFLEEKYPEIRFVYPFVTGYNMVFKDSSLGFIDGPFKTHEPIGKEVFKDNIDLIVVPALAVNKNNYRLGYGKGYYDRYLSDYNGQTLTFVSKELLLDFEPEEHDVKIKEVIFL